MKRLMILGVALCLSGCLERATPEESARMIAVGRMLSGAGAAMRGSEVASPEPGAGMACQLAAQQVSGMYRNCVYRCGAAGVVARTVGAADFCPITLD